MLLGGVRSRISRTPGLEIRDLTPEIPHAVSRLRASDVQRTPAAPILFLWSDVLGEVAFVTCRKLPEMHADDRLAARIAPGARLWQLRIAINRYSRKTQTGTKS